MLSIFCMNWVHYQIVYKWLSLLLKKLLTQKGKFHNYFCPSQSLASMVLSKEFVSHCLLYINWTLFIKFIKLFGLTFTHLWTISSFTIKRKTSSIFLSNWFFIVYLNKILVGHKEYFPQLSLRELAFIHL